jgi:threonine synthase
MTGINTPPVRTATFNAVCTDCSRDLGDRFTPFCPSCGGIADISYDLERVVLRDSSNPYVRFIDLLPVRDAGRLPRDASVTPTVHATALGAHLGLTALYLKDETGLPTGTTKDRMAAVALPYLYERGVRRFTTSSTGNSSTAYGQAIHRVPELEMYVFTAQTFRPRLALPASDQVVDVVVEDASFVEAFDLAGTVAAAHGLASERGFFNPGRREGLKLAWLEAAEQVPGEIDWYVQAVSSAMGVYGVYKAAGERVALGLAERVPRLMCVQQESCAPMVAAWRAGSETIRPADVVPRPAGVAEAILRGNPTRVYPHVRRIVADSGGTFEAVTEAEIRAAHALIRELEGIPAGFEAAAAVAGLMRQCQAGVVQRDETVLVNLTGADRPRVDPGRDACSRVVVSRSADGWELGQLERTLRTRRPPADRRTPPPPPAARG